MVCNLGLSLYSMSAIKIKIRNNGTSFPGNNCVSLPGNIGVGVIGRVLYTNNAVLVRERRGSCRGHLRRHEHDSECHFRIDGEGGAAPLGAVVVCEHHQSVTSLCIQKRHDIIVLSQQLNFAPNLCADSIAHRLWLRYDVLTALLRLLLRRDIRG